MEREDYFWWPLFIISIAVLVVFTAFLTVQSHETSNQKAIDNFQEEIDFCMEKEGSFDIVNRIWFLDTVKCTFIDDSYFVNSYYIGKTSGGQIYFYQCRGDCK